MKTKDSHTIKVSLSTIESHQGILSYIRQHKQIHNVPARVATFYTEYNLTTSRASSALKSRSSHVS